MVWGSIFHIQELETHGVGVNIPRVLVGNKCDQVIWKLLYYTVLRSVYTNFVSFYIILYCTLTEYYPL